MTGCGSWTSREIMTRAAHLRDQGVSLTASLCAESPNVAHINRMLLTKASSKARDKLLEAGPTLLFRGL